MLKGKVALVTGAGRGIGRAIALTLASYGANVIVNYSGSKEQAEAVVEEIRQMGQEAEAVCANVAKEEDCVQLFKRTVEIFGTVDIVVNNAGVTKDGLTARMSESDFDCVIDVNLKGTFFCMKQASILMMKKRYGRIINISSIVGVRGNAGQINYSGAKAGIIGMTKSLAKELAARNITVNAVAPGYIETDMTAGLSEKVKEQTLAQIPVKRMGKPEEIAQVVAFLASDHGAYITGQTIQVDGGIGI